MPPHHGPGGRFRNPWPGREPHRIHDVIRMLGEQLGPGRAPNPARGSFPADEPEISLPNAADGTATATWVGHSTVLLQMGAVNILTDPMWSERASPMQWMGPRRVMPPGVGFDALPPIDVVLLSHNHYDHLDEATARRLARAHPEARWIVPARLGRYLQRWGVRHATELDWWEEADVAGATITATPACHFSARRLGDRNRTLWCGYAIGHAGRRAWFAGDTAYHPEFAEISRRCGPFDLALIPVGAYAPRWFMRVVHVDPAEAVRLYQDLVSAHPAAPGPLMLAIHWGTFRLTSEPMEEPPRRTRECWKAAGLDDARLWTARFGETRRW